MQKCLSPLLALLLLSAAGAAPDDPGTAQDTRLQRVLSAYQAARPADRELGAFRLDWAGSLKEAKTRAAREKRPIFFVSTMQLKDAGDLRGGHC
jgi:hypothetical protein